MKNHFLSLISAFIALLIPTTHTALASNPVTSQKSGFSLTYSTFGENDVFRYEELVGAAGYHGKGFFAVGATYLFPLTSWLGLESGLEYAKHTVIVIPNLPPTIDVILRESHFSIINIPLTLHAGLGKYFFANGGIMLNLDTTIKSPITDQTGLGAILGLGVQYTFHPMLTVFVNPYGKLYSMVPFTFDNYPQRVLESGLRFGVRFRL